MDRPASLSCAERVATITMADPARRNALGPAMLAELSRLFRSLAGQDIRAVVLRAGPTDSVWCAGFDVRELVPGFDPLAPGGPLQTLFELVDACPAPVIAMLHGTAWGGGADLALRCDLAVADETFAIAFTPGKLGLPYDLGGLRNVLLRAGPGLAMEMFASAAPVSAERALRHGLINHLVPEAELEPFTVALARQIAGNAPLSVASAKRHLRALAAAVPLPEEAALRAVRDAALASADYAEGIEAFRARRPPVFNGR